MTKKLFIISIAVSILLCAAPAVAGAATIVSDSSIATDTEWTLDQSPYIIIKDFTIPRGTTLTIDPGVVVKFSGRVNLFICGTIVANGTSDNEIYFTRIDDYSIGEVTDDLDGYSLYGHYEIITEGGSLVMNNSEIRNIDNGIDMEGGGLSFNNVSISGSDPTIDDLNGPINFSNVDIGGAAGYAILLGGPYAHLTADNVFIHDSNGGIAGWSNGSVSGNELNFSRLMGPAINTIGGSVSLSNSTLTDIYAGLGAAAIETTWSSLAVSSSTISNVYGAAVNILNGDNSSISNTTIASTTEGIEINDNVPNISNYNPYAVNTIASSTISNIDDEAILSSGTKINVSNTNINNAAYGVESDKSSVNISSSSLENISQYGAYNSPTSPLMIAENNYWGDLSGPYNPNSNPTGLGVPVSDNVDFANWLGSDPTALVTVPTCCSNVMFLPGIEGSRLYMPGTLIENELWEPNRDNDGKLLEFDANGNSINQNIYTKVGDIVDVAYYRFIRSFGPDFYKTFDDDMDSLKSDGTINDWEPIAYDWRLSYDQILDSGKVTGDEISYLSATFSPYIIQELKRLAGDSKTGKVTIVAHSNGGLLAKDLMIKLQNEGLANLVDKIVFVAVPQIGTPDAIGALLHGFGQSIGIYFIHLFSANEARELAQNMPMTYNLLPSKAYFDSVTTPVITYDATSTIPLIESFVTHYGQSIDSYDSFKDFLFGNEGRAMPSYDDLTYPSIGNSILVNSSATTHDVLDNWTPPKGITLIQIAGWGDDTPSGIYYYQGLLKGESALEYKPTLVEDGDGTVVVPSALATPTDTNVERYWLDLGKYNSDNKSDISHGTIFGVASLEDFLKNIVQDNNYVLPQYFSTTSPTDIPGEELRFFLHAASSTIDVYDDAGNHTGISTTTGLVEENVSGTTYRNFGNVTLVTIPATHSSSTSSTDPSTGSGQASSSKTEKVTKVKKAKIKVVVKSNVSDSISINVDDAVGENISSSISFVDIPVSTSSIAEIDIATSSPQIADVSYVDVSDDNSNTNDFDVLPAENATTSSIIVSDNDSENQDNNQNNSENIGTTTDNTENNDNNTNNETDQNISQTIQTTETNQTIQTNKSNFHPGSNQKISTQDTNPGDTMIALNMPIENFVNAYLAYSKSENQNTEASEYAVSPKSNPTNSNVSNTETASVLNAVSNAGVADFIWNGLQSAIKSVTDFFGSIF